MAAKSASLILFRVSPSVNGDGAEYTIAPNWSVAAWFSDTFGNARGNSRKDRLIAIRPKGVPYERLSVKHIVITNWTGRLWRASCDHRPICLAKTLTTARKKLND